MTGDEAARVMPGGVSRLSAPREAGRGSPSLRRLLALIAGALSAITILLLAQPAIRFVMVAADVDIVLNTTSAIAAGAVATLSWTRFSERRQTRDLLHAAAFLTLFMAGTLAVVAPLIGADIDLGMRLDAPSQVPVYMWLVARLFAALIIVAAAIAPARSPWLARVPAPAVLAAPATAFLVLLALVSVGHPHLPPLLGADAFATLRTGPAVPSQLPGVTLLGDALELTVAVAFLAAAFLEARSHEREGGAGRPFMAVGLVVAAFAQLHSAIYPGSFVGLVTTGDILRLVFYLTLLFGIQAEARADIHALRVANYELERLTESEAARGAVDERARLAREIHDGLAQDLWFAKSEVSRLEQERDLTPEMASTVREVRESIEVALAEARQAFRALNVTELSGSFPDMLGRHIAEVAERAGLLGEFTCDPSLPTVSPGVGIELLRIAQEALTNVRKHADATVVRVRLSSADGVLRLVVADNGCGFDPSAAAAEGFGISSMRERATRIGGTVEVESTPRGGSTVTASVPIPQT